MTDTDRPDRSAHLDDVVRLSDELGLYDRHPDLEALADRLALAADTHAATHEAVNSVDSGYFSDWHARRAGDLNAAARILRAVANALPVLLDTHVQDGPFCRECGATGGRWPCTTRLELDALLKSITGDTDP